MNAKKLAEALRRIAKLAYERHKGIDGMLFEDAAAACEEEGSNEKNIAGHEHQIGQLEMKVAALEEWKRFVFDPPAPPPGATAPTPAGVAPEEEHKSKLYERMGKIWAAAASPEQAQETGEEMARRVTKKAIHDALAPEQARRTWEVHPGKNTTALYECSGIGCNDCKLYGAPFIVTQLRPGERIVGPADGAKAPVGGAEAPSGEGVRVHEYSERPGEWEPCQIFDGRCGCEGLSSYRRGILYPERTPGAPESEGRNAPARAEEK